MRSDKLAPCHSKSTAATDEHCTPKAFFKYIQKTCKVKFTIDVAASKQNTLCKLYITKSMNALNRNWGGVGWCNPPYSMAKEFVAHCFNNARLQHGSTFMLLAARTDREWWHKYASRAAYIIFIKGRLKFAGAKAGAPFPSILLVFKKGFRGKTKNIYLAPTPYERGFSRGKPV